AVNHRAAGTDGIVSLPPVKSAAAARNLVERPVVQVGPRKPRENHRHIINSIAGAVGQVRHDLVYAEIIHFRSITVTSDGPRTDDVEGTENAAPGRIGLCIVAQGPPMRRQPAHDGAAGGLEPVNGLLRLLRRIGASAETKAPDGDDR